MRPRRYHHSWECPRCTWSYESPIEIEDAWHRCPARTGSTVHLRPKKEAHK